MQFTVRDILNLEILNGIDVVAGEQGLNRKITNVTVLDAPDAIDWLRGHEFVITTLYPFKEASDQKRLVHSLAKRNVSALGIKLKRFVHALPQEVIDLANEYSLPLLQIPIEKAWVDLINPIMAEILNRQFVVLEKSNAIRRSFINEVLEGGKLKSIVKVLSELTHTPVTIMELINRSGVTWPYYFKDHISKDDILDLQNNHQDVNPGNVTSVINKNIEGKVFPIKADKKTEGYIIVWETKRLNELDYVAIEHATTVAALHIQQLKAVNEVNQRVKDDFISNLLQGQFSYSYAKQKAEELGWELSPQNAVVVIKAIQQCGSDWKKSHSIFNFVKDVIKADCGIDIPMGMDGSNKIILLIPGKAGENNFTKIVKTLLAAKSEITISDQDVRIAIGIGRTYELLEKLPNSYKEACIACQVNIPLNQELTSYEKLGVYSLLVEMVDRQETEEYLSKFVYPIVKFDSEHKADLLNTLETFIDSGSNYRETAKILYVHHNTIRYRLETIEKLLKVDFKQPETALSLMLATKLFKLKS